MNIDRSEMCYISMDLTRQGLQTNGKFFFQISESFFELVTFLKIIVALGLFKRGGGGICAEQHPFYFITHFLEWQNTSKSSCSDGR